MADPLKGSAPPRIEEAVTHDARLSDGQAALEGPSSEPLDPSEVFRHFAPLVGRWAHRLGGPAIDADDVVQEVFVRVYEQLHRFRGESKLSTWLFQITLNEVRGRRRKERFLGWLSRGASDEALEVVESPTESALTKLERTQDIERLYRALDGLSDKYRTPLVMFEIEGLSGEAIAELLNVNLSTVWVWLHRGRAQLLKRLEADGKGRG